MKYLKVEVSREEYSEVYVSVPDDFSAMSFYAAKSAIDLQQLVKDQCRDYDWEKGNDIEIQSIVTVEESEAKAYGASDLSNYVPQEILDKKVTQDDHRQLLLF